LRRFTSVSAGSASHAASMRPLSIAATAAAPLPMPVTLTESTGT
jgi:hypothetical protein